MELIQEKSLGINDLQSSGLNSPQLESARGAEHLRYFPRDKKAGKAARKAVRNNGMSGNQLWMKK